MDATALPAQTEVYVFDGFVLNTKRRSLSLGNREVVLGSRALDLLIALVEHAGEVLRRDYLVSRAWPRTIVEESSLRVHIGAIRKALNDRAAESRYITNVPGRGYCFVGKVVREPRPAPTASVEGLLLPRLTGRESSLRALDGMVRRCHVASIIGPAGVGKTSVARHALARLAPEFAGGACWVDLSGPGPGGVMARLAGQLGLPGADRAGLASALRNTGMLIVLDNCEHVLEEVADLVDAISSQAATTRIICTSREPIDAAGEHVLRLEPLGLAAATARTLSDALQAPAIALFVERARATADTVVFDDADVADLRELCRQLDGIPLALELAAWRIAALGLKGLLARSGDWLALLTRGRRGAQPRHQSLRAAIDWSFDLLDETERQVLCCLAVFDAQFTLTHAAAVVVMPQGAARVEEVVLRLVDKSLLMPCLHARDTDDGTCYRLLQTTRSYALERLADLPEAEAVWARHARAMPRQAGPASPVAGKPIAAKILQT